MSSGPQILTPPYYERLYALEEQHGWTRGMRDFAGALLAPLLQGNNVCRVLDAGCGTGGMLSWMQRFQPTTVVGIDLSAHALDFSRQRGHRALVQGSVTCLPFRDQSFDLVMSADVLQHLPDPPGDQAALAETYRVLSPGGYLYVRTNSTFGFGPPASGEGADYRRYDRARLIEQMAAAGFAVERVSFANSLPSLLATARQRLRGHGKAAPGHNSGLGVEVRPAHLRWVDQVLVALLHIEAWYVTRLGRSLPFGHTLLALARKPEAPAALASGASQPREDADRLAASSSPVSDAVA